MKINELKSLVQNYTIEQLKQAELDLVEGKALEITVNGDDEGEQLTHILGAIWVHEEIAQNGTDLMTAVRQFAQRVRSSIN